MAFAIKDKKITPVLVEFSGGVKFNTTDKKEQDDETKMAGKILSIMTNVEALQMIDYQIPQHYIRFFGRYFSVYNITSVLAKILFILYCRRRNYLRVYLLIKKRSMHKKKVLRNDLPYYL